jgi:hypothetical protein
MIFFFLLLVLLAWTEGRTIDGRDRRVISVPDLHGDYDCLLNILQSAKLVSGNRSWTGGNAVLIQLGDVLDRGNDSAMIFQLLATLQEEAAAVDGIVEILMGNHEWMNLQGDFRYAGETEQLHSFLSRVEVLNGPLGEFIRSFPLVVQVTYDWYDQGIVFVHGGLQSKFAVEDPSLDRMDSPSGPLWDRFLARGSDLDAVCADSDRTLTLTRSNRMVVGHTKQTEVSLRCNGRLVLSDTEECTGLEHFSNGTFVVLR